MEFEFAIVVLVLILILFEICWRLWTAMANQTGLLQEYHKELANAERPTSALRSENEQLLERMVLLQRSKEHDTLEVSVSPTVHLRKYFSID